jgi:uncharacterized protein (DUF4415 family)
MSSTDKLDRMEFGTVEIPEGALDGRSAKVRITMMVDADVLAGFKLRAAEEHAKYQTLMNRTLRESLKSPSGATLEGRIAALEQIVRRRKLGGRPKKLSGGARKRD